MNITIPDPTDAIQTLWQPFTPIKTAEDYIESLRGRNMTVYYLGEKIDEPVDHPVIWPSINALAETYRLAIDNPEIATATSPLTGQPINRFLHVPEGPQDLVLKAEMQRELGRRTGTCFQRCVGMDALGSLHSVTYDMDQECGTDYHQRFLAFLGQVQKRNLVIAGAMTDPKGDRSKAPHEQSDPDLFLHVTRRTKTGMYVTGAKMHLTGCINSHWVIFMPTVRLSENDKDYAVVGAIPADAPGLTYIYGRQSCDTRILDGGDIDAGNPHYSGQEAMMIFDDVFVPFEHVFMDGEYTYAASLVERFTSYHRASYVCKTGLGDVLVGAAATAADYNGVEGASHIRDKLVEMTYLNETIYASAKASAYQANELPSGAWINDAMLANICKHNVTRFPYEIARLAQDIAGGLLVTMPSEKDLDNEETGGLIRKFLMGRDGIDSVDRMKILRLIENMTIGRNAVGYLTESLHGAGSPQAQRILIARLAEIDNKKKLAQRLANVGQ
ncbi:MAG: 4-hydroxybutyryl-CoA dehydratase [Alphaproteobacteria bacterium]|nr:MAG: 4-hydroxybutyryl-CoA dehydratase [Alphaproteobacteria bacterium]